MLNYVANTPLVINVKLIHNGTSIIASAFTLFQRRMCIWPILEEIWTIDTTKCHRYGSKTAIIFPYTVMEFDNTIRKKQSPALKPGEWNFWQVSEFCPPELATWL